MTFTAGNRDIGAVYKVGTELADTLVGRALDRGVNFFDTADGYADGQSETLLGRALASRRDGVVIATKVGFRTGSPLTQAGLSRRHILWSVDQSLRRLGTDWIDVYLAHREDPHTPIEETLGAFDAVVRAGKVRYIGFSNWSAWKASAALEIQKANGSGAGQEPLRWRLVVWAITTVRPSRSRATAEPTRATMRGVLSGGGG